MTEFTLLVAGPLGTNCYIVWDSSTRQAAIIDPGGSTEAILRVVSERHLRVERVLLTHGHPDHTFCAGEVAKSLGARIAMHESDTALNEAALQLAALYYDMSGYVPFTADDLLRDGDVIDLGETSLEVMHTPGHSPGGLCFVTDVGVFCGDTIFAGSIGRTDFPGGSLDTLLNSIREKLLPLSDDTPLHPGHGPDTTVGSERADNPFLQCTRS